MTFSEIPLALRFLSAVGAAWLLTLYLVYEDGPPLPGIGPVFLRLRQAAGYRPFVRLEVDGCSDLVPLEQLPAGVYCPEEIVYHHDGQFLARMLDCHRCAGFWAGLLIGLLTFGVSLSGLFLALGATGISIAAHEALAVRRGE